MNVSSQELNDHSRVIIHIDIDCFYAQVEMVKNPSLKLLPIGIQQKNIIVTSNYVAREFGIKKCMLLSEAKRICTDLVVVNGEDLHDYKQYSQKVTDLCYKYSPLVERLGLDENYIDVTKLAQENLRTSSVKAIGQIFGDTETFCDCGCAERIKYGSMIAHDIRTAIYEQLGLTTCAGIAHNKLLAKLVGTKHKPNQQTLIFPENALQLMLTLNLARKIPGIGQSINNTLSSIGIVTIGDLQNANINLLSEKIGCEKAKIFINLSYGCDVSSVKPSGKPQNISVEDSNRGICSLPEVQNKLKELLRRLMILVAEDGRVPNCIRLTLRILDKINKTQTRTSKQTNVLPSLFNVKNLSSLTETNENKILGVLMKLFKDIIGAANSFHLTLIGISFSKFTDINIDTKNILYNFLQSKSSKQESCSNTQILNDVDLEPKSKRAKLSEKTESGISNQDISLNITSNADIPCPPNIAQEVFIELPSDIKMELWQNYKYQTNISKKNRSTSILNYFQPI